MTPGADHAVDRDATPEPAPPPASSPWLIPALVFALALTVRLVYLAQIHLSPFYDIRYLKGSDAYNFFVWALGIYSGENVDSDIYTLQTPLYPMFLAAVFRIAGGGNLLAPRLAQFVLGSLTPVAAYGLGRHLRGRAAGAVAGVITALYGPLIFYDGAFLRDGLLTLSYCAFVYVLAANRKRGGLGAAGAAGILFGISVLGKPNIVLMAPVIGWWCWRAGTARTVRLDQAGSWARVRATVLVAGVLAAGFVLAMVPFWLSDLRRTIKAGAMSKNSAYVLLNSNHPTTAPADLGVREVSFSNRINPVVGQLADRLEWNTPRAAWALAEIYRDRPGYFMRVQLAKVWLLLYGYEVPENLNYYVEKRYVPFFRLPWLTWPVLLGLAVVGIWATRRTWRDQIEVHSYLVLYSAGLIIFFVVARYRLPLVPVLAAYAGAGVVGMVELGRAKKYGRLAVAMVVAALIMTAVWPRVLDPLRTHDYHNLVRFHLMKKENDQARQIAREGTDRARRIAAQTDSAFAHYRLARMLFLDGRPFAEVQAELDRARGKSPDDWLVYLIGELEALCRQRIEQGDNLVGGFRL